jgi:hypothetical protein
MTPTQRAAALRLADLLLDEKAMETEPLPHPDHRPEAATLLRELLAEPQGEPVAWQWLDTATFRERIPPTAVAAHWRPLFAAPQQRQPLSDDDLETMWLRRDCIAAIQAGDIIGQVCAFARAVEAAHGIGETK